MPALLLLFGLVVMRRVLIIAYYTPPLAMGGVQRVTKLAKYLPEFGWTPAILTVKSISYYAYDVSLLEDLASVPLFRSESLDPARLRRLVTRSDITPNHIRKTSATNAVRAVLPIDSKSPWLPFAYRLGKQIVRSFRPDLVFSTAPPFSSHIVGLLLKKKFHLPLVIDFRDPYRPMAGPTPVHRLLQRCAFDRVRRAADGVVAVTGKTAEILGMRALIIENGFDPADFTARPAEPDARFTIGYMGALIERETSLLCLLEALQRLDGVVLKIVGYADKHLIEPYGPKVEYCGYLSHRAALAVIKSCNLLWLSTGERSDLAPVPGKFFEYLATGKPILVTVQDENEITHYLREYRAGIAVPSEPDAIYRAIRTFQTGQFRSTPKPVSRFSRRYQASLLADYFNRTIETRPGSS